MRRSRMLAAAIAATALGLAGCSGGGADDGRRTKEVRAAQTMGQGEGLVSLVSWNGYAESGGNDPRVDWITPFEKKTKCQVKMKYAANPQEMLDLMSNPDLHYDGVAATPEIAGELIASKQAVPINTDLIDDYKDLEPELRSQLTVKGKHYAVPFTWGANLLMYDPRTVRPQPDSWAALFDSAQAKKYSGRLVVRDSPLTLGDAALYLRSHNRKLHIKDPFALTPKQLAAAAALVDKQRPMVKTYWLNPSDAIAAFATGDAALGEVWPYQVDVLSRSGRPVAGVTPREGVTGWMDAWMMSPRADHPNCMYQWLNWASSPEVQQQVAEWDGVAPANPDACARDRLRPQFCSAYHVGDRDYLSKVMFARMPAASCVNNKSCADYADWNRAWRDARD
ncbi:ABC transporter substrate-binding protein [Actinoallomurus sp. NBC_01490]|uniref:ABC transporter substrate-binding protein n=1 Tax=Actinoallomurus sp. NBC_01490 TaxID=2903557 RepID=UPI002E359B89|nr:ABC transporter substrate-binding protein [Actinoallomurus sp. NBC_01490]